MKTQEEINEKLEELHDKEEGIKHSKEEVSNELKVIMVSSQLQQRVIKSSLNKTEEELQEKLKEESEKLEYINNEYEKASKENNISRKKDLNALEWTCSIKVHTLNWILGNTKEIPEDKLPF